MAPLFTHKWPRHVPVTTIVCSLAGAVALVVAAVLLTNADQNPVCGGVLLGAADQCDINGSLVSYATMASSPLPSVIFAAAAGLVGWLLLHLRRQGKPTKREIDHFERCARVRRRELGETYDSSPEAQRQWATRDTLLARFDVEVERQRKRKGFSAKATTT